MKIASYSFAKIEFAWRYLYYPEYRVVKPLYVDWLGRYAMLIEKKEA